MRNVDRGNYKLKGNEPFVSINYRYSSDVNRAEMQSTFTTHCLILNRYKKHQEEVNSYLMQSMVVSKSPISVKTFQGNMLASSTNTTVFTVPFIKKNQLPPPAYPYFFSSFPPPSSPLYKLSLTTMPIENLLPSLM